MGEPGNSQGAEAVLTWQTGFPTSVDLSAGYPRSLPEVTTARRRIPCGEADLVLVVGSVPTEQFDDDWQGCLEKVPTLVIAPPDDTASLLPLPEPLIRAFAATPGIDDSGSVMRVDGITLPLRPIRDALADRAAMAGGHFASDDIDKETLIWIPDVGGSNARHRVAAPRPGFLVPIRSTPGCSVLGKARCGRLVAVCP